MATPPLQIPTLDVNVTNQGPIPVSVQAPLNVNVAVTPRTGLVFSDLVAGVPQVFFTAPPNSAWQVYLQIWQPAPNACLRIGRSMFFGPGNPPGLEGAEGRKLDPATDLGKAFPLVSGESVELINAASHYYIQIVQL